MIGDFSSTLTRPLVLPLGLLKNHRDITDGHGCLHGSSPFKENLITTRGFLMGYLQHALYTLGVLRQVGTY